MNSDPARNFACDYSAVSRRRLGAHATALRLLAGQPDGRRADARRLARAVRAVGPPRLRDRLRRMLFRDLFRRSRRRRSAAWKPRTSSAARLPQRLVMLSSLSKRSNVPGMRSGFVAGDAAILKSFLLYRTYHGAAMSPPCSRRRASPRGSDEAHVRDNRAQYRKNSRPSRRCSPTCSTSACPTPRSTCGRTSRAPASRTPSSRARLYADYNVTVLPGSLSRARRARHESRRAGSCASRSSPMSTNASREPAASSSSAARSMRNKAAAVNPSSITDTTDMSQQLQQIIDTAWENRAELSPKAAPAEVRDAVAHAIEQLDKGQLRVAEKKDGDWVVNQWLKKAVLLSFRLEDNAPMPAGGYSQFFDKVPSKFANYTAEDFAAGGFRVVPPAIARRGSLHREERRADAVVRQHRRLRRRRHDGRHLGHRRLVRADRQERAPVGRRGHRRRAGAAAGEPRSSSRTTASSARARKSSKA